MTVFSHPQRSNAFNRASTVSQFEINSPILLIREWLIRFEVHELDRAQGQLTWHFESISLNRKTFDSLLYLANPRTCSWQGAAAPVAEELSIGESAHGELLREP